jgi:hypothetical protein
MSDQLLDLIAAVLTFAAFCIVAAPVAVAVERKLIRLYVIRGVVAVGTASAPRRGGARTREAAPTNSSYECSSRSCGLRPSTRKEAMPRDNSIP